MFKVGDRVRIKEDCTQCIAGESAILNLGAKSGTQKYLLFAWGAGFTANCSCADNWELIEESLTNKQMNIQEKFVLALTPEPKKSFRKAGITNGDDLLTDEGQKIFLTWLLHTKFSDEFKTGVVDGMQQRQQRRFLE